MNKPIETNRHGKNFYDINKLNPEFMEVKINSKGTKDVYAMEKLVGESELIEIRTKKLYNAGTITYLPKGYPRVVKIRQSILNGEYKVCLYSANSNTMSREKAIELAKTVLAIKDRDVNAVITSYKETRNK